jgi:cell division control protein 24
LNISYQTLKDRIDAKLQRSTNLTLGTANGGPGAPSTNKDNVVKLKYLDEDDYVTIQTDEDVQEAFETWREQRGGDLGGDGMGGMGEIELFCQR